MGTIQRTERGKDIKKNKNSPNVILSKAKNFMYFLSA